MKAEDFFPLGWEGRQFRRQPYPDMTYEEAISAAKTVLWNMDTPEATAVSNELQDIGWDLLTEHGQFPGRSILLVTELNELWRGKVTTLLTWFQKAGKPAPSSGDGFGPYCDHAKPYDPSICSYDCYIKEGAK